MTGGENQPGSWMLKTEKLSRAKPRTFDSYEPFPAARRRVPGRRHQRQDPAERQAGLAGQRLAIRANATVTVPFDFSVDVAAGDKLAFLVNMNGNIGLDTTAFDPTITYDDGETHVASKEFSDKQGQNGWRYQYLEGGKFVDLVYYPGPKQWRKEKDNATGTPFVGAGRPASRRGPGCRARLDGAQGGPRARHRLGLQHGQSARRQRRLRLPHGHVELRPLVRPAGQRHAARGWSSAGTISATGPRRSSWTPTGRSRSN